MKRKIIWVVVLALIVGLGVYAFRYRESHKAPEITYKTAPASKRRIVASITASGTVSALVTVQVGSQVSGRIQMLNADFNSHVKKGQVVAKIDPQLFQAAAEQANASFQSAQANVMKAEATANQSEKQLARTKALREQGLASQQDMETAEANAATDKASVDVAKASLSQARANLNTAQVNLSYTTILSPIDGVVISRSVDVGQTVAASLSAPTLFTIAQDLTRMQVDTNVSEGDVGRLAQGMVASFSVDAYPGKTFKGTISDVRNAPTTVQNVVTYDAVIKVDNDELKLKPGMTANVTIIYQQRDGVLSIPNAAIRFKPTNLPAAPSSSASGGADGDGGAGGAGGRGGWDGGAGGGRRGGGAGGPSGGGMGRGRSTKNEDGTETKTLYVMKGDTPTPVVLKLGLSDGTNTEVVSGDLAEGDAVITDQEGGTPSAAAGATVKRLF
jgi:HlyD family secretion protein